MTLKERLEDAGYNTRRMFHKHNWIDRWCSGIYNNLLWIDYIEGCKKCGISRFDWYDFKYPNRVLEPVYP